MFLLGAWLPDECRARFNDIDPDLTRDELDLITRLIEEHEFAPEITLVFLPRTFRLLAVHVVRSLAGVRLVIPRIAELHIVILSLNLLGA